MGEFEWVGLTGGGGGDIGIEGEEGKGGRCAVSRYDELCGLSEGEGEPWFCGSM